jgi:hypothetical protein
MAAAGATPRLDPQAGLAAFEEDLPRVLRMLDVQSIEELGWSRPTKLSLLVPMVGAPGDRTDEFMLKLGFQAYREWPPSAQFVNPETLNFVMGQDERFVPRLTSGECQTHIAYTHPRGGQIQLICCSATLEFYDVAHGVEPRHVWDGNSTFYSTITAVRRAMNESYQGRFGE